VDKVGLSLLVATPIAHAFWADTNPSARAEDINNFSKNVGLLLRGAMMALICGSQDLTLQAILSNGVATVRRTLRRMFSAMAAERAKKRRKLVLTPDL
jgi:hypothetical protein